MRCEERIERGPKCLLETRARRGAAPRPSPACALIAARESPWRVRASVAEDKKLRSPARGGGAQDPLLLLAVVQLRHARFELINTCQAGDPDELRDRIVCEGIGLGLESERSKRVGDRRSATPPGRGRARIGACAGAVQESGRALASSGGRRRAITAATRRRLWRVHSLSRRRATSIVRPSRSSASRRRLSSCCRSTPFSARSDSDTVRAHVRSNRLSAAALDELSRNVGRQPRPHELLVDVLELD